MGEFVGHVGGVICSLSGYNYAMCLSLSMFTYIVDSVC